LDVLREKKTNPNTLNIPVIIVAQGVDQKRIIELAFYDVKRIFNKPIKIDALFAALSELLGIPFSIDETPGIMEVHVNDAIIFIEISQGLNRDKLDLLRFKIIELMDLYEIRIPKVIIMLSNLALSSADEPKLRKLLDTVLRASGAKSRHIRILTKDEFFEKFIGGQKEYAGIEVVSSLDHAMDGLLAELDRGMEYGEKKAEIIADKVLAADDHGAGEESMQLRFDAETRARLGVEKIREDGHTLKIAAVDDDFVIQELIKNAFFKIGAVVTSFSGGSEFIAAAEEGSFDLVFLDLVMPGMDGFEVLGNLQNKNIQAPVIILSAITRRDMVIRAFQMGIKSYLVKPLKPEDIFKKSMEILRTNF
jgi:CheY-like chemotaxis protein